MKVPFCPNPEHKGKKFKLHKGDKTDNSVMYCPECGNVYHKNGNDFNQLQPNWEKVSRIVSKRALASHIILCDENIAPELAIDYIESQDLGEEEKRALKNYAKFGCLMKLKG